MTDPEEHGPRLSAMFDKVEALTSSLAEGAGEVEPRSSLAADDAQWPSMPVSVLASTGVLVAVEDLAALRLLYVKARTVVPSPYVTLSRSALLAAATACWLLLPSRREERVVRGLRLAYDDYGDAAGLSGDLRNLRPDGLAHLLPAAELRQTEAATAREEVRQELVRRGYVVPKRGNAAAATTMLSEALHDAHPTDPMMVFGGMALWRRGGGSAHARTWTSIAFGEVTGPGSTKGTRLVKSNLTPGDLVQCLGAPLFLLSAAADQWDRRRRAVTA